MCAVLSNSLIICSSSPSTSCLVSDFCCIFVGSLAISTTATGDFVMIGSGGTTSAGGSADAGEAKRMREARGFADRMKKLADTILAPVAGREDVAMLFTAVDARSFSLLSSLPHPILSLSASSILTERANAVIAMSSKFEDVVLVRPFAVSRQNGLCLQQNETFTSTRRRRSSASSSC